MSDNSKIEWLARPRTVPASWNPVTGCTKISEGCKHCYAERMAKRLAGRFGYPADDPFRVTWHPDRLTEPLRWRKPRTVFVCSMGDLFHRDVPGTLILDVWRVMQRTPQHTYIVLTKRADRMEHILNKWLPSAWEISFMESYPGTLPNVWLGVTAENQQRANKRIPLLLQCSAAVRFVSIEPIVGPVDVSNWTGGFLEGRLSGYDEAGRYVESDLYRQYIPAPVQLDWIICGGESGPGARPMNPDWARDVRDQCAAAGVPFFFKQWGSTKMPHPLWDEANMAGWNPREKKGGHLLDGKENREWPAVAVRA